MSFSASSNLARPLSTDVRKRQTTNPAHVEENTRVVIRFTKVVPKVGPITPLLSPLGPVDVKGIIVD